MTFVDGATGVDGLELGPPPRAPWWSGRSRPLVAAGAAVLAVVVVTLVATGDDDRPATPPTVTAPPRSTGFAAGPVLAEVDGHDQLAVPGGAMFGGAAMNVDLAPATDAVAALAATLPSFGNIRGGRVTDPEIHYGIYLTGTYTATNGGPVQLTVYTARAAGTPASHAATVDRVLADGVTLVRTDVSVYTGTGWWVHGVALAPDGTDDLAGQADPLQRALADPRLVA